MWLAYSIKMETRSGNSGYGGVTREQEADRRMVRKRYNDLKQRVKSSTTDLTDVIKEADELLDVVEKKEMTAREAVLDANVFKQISTKCREQAQVHDFNQILAIPNFIHIYYSIKITCQL